MTVRAPTSAATGVRHLPLAQAPDGVEQLGTWRLDSTAQLRALRAGLHDALRAPRSVGDPVVLVASELATNALRHGEPPATVSLGRTPEAFVLDVADGAVDAVPVLAERRPLGEGGYGLYLAGRLADDLGWYAAEGRKHVWAAFRR